MSDYRTYQLLSTLIAYPTLWRRLQGLPTTQRPRPTAFERGLAWLGRRMVAVGETLQARYGDAAEASARLQPERSGVVL